MWWSKAALVVGLLALGPVGCGFQPMYAKPDPQNASPVAAELASVRILGIEDRQGQILRNALVNRMSPLGEPGRADYILAVRLTQNQENLAERSDGKASLGRLFISATFTLTENQKEAPVFSGSSRSVVSYRLLGPTYGSTAVERDAEKRALGDLAEDIRSQVATFFANGKRARGNRS
ncbi:LPS assembly lipoprotein LptE [Magnetospirillum sp. 64-120]|uniref:LPS assembly lipoprotein LptE n=1 Tax=Magnetospirillum sp. 64-120 TaxID=1895778 RepID=UPI0025B7F939|nr:LPS assembly lipoprotein LptE [Magnetospirillum sp. 64-120]